MTDEELNKAGGSAFPSGDGQYAGGPCHQNGMTLRDWLAGNALSALASNALRTNALIAEPTRCAAFAYAVADAMLEARKK